MIPHIIGRRRLCKHKPEVAAIKNPNGYFGIKDRRIKKHRGHKKAIAAIARMILICICHMLLTGESFHPSDYDELMNPRPRKPHELTIESALDFLKSTCADIDAIIVSLKETLPDSSAVLC